MTSQEALTLSEAFIPAVIGGSLALLAIIGIGELFKETSAAFKKGLKA